MSFCRSTSNPESLYIIHSISGQIEFMGDYGNRNLTMDPESFYGLCEKYIRDYEEYEYENILENYNDNTLSLFKHKLATLAVGVNQTYIFYELWEKPIVMWESTWSHIVYRRHEFYPLPVRIGWWFWFKIDQIKDVIKLIVPIAKLG